MGARWAGRELRNLGFVTDCQAHPGLKWRAKRRQPRCDLSKNPRNDVARMQHPRHQKRNGKPFLTFSGVPARVLRKLLGGLQPDSGLNNHEK